MCMHNSPGESSMYYVLQRPPVLEHGKAGTFMMIFLILMNRSAGCALVKKSAKLSEVATKGTQI